MKRKKNIVIGILAFQGDVAEHARALEEAAEKLRAQVSVVLVRTREGLQGLDGLIIPGGESTTLQKLCEREGMFEAMKKVKNIFGTCAGAILMAKTVQNRAQGQETLELMDITVDRNAYGRQTESFEETLKTTLGPVRAVFIRAPKILHIGKEVSVLAEGNGGVVACEEKSRGRFYLAFSFHPELTTGLFHEYFLQRIIDKIT